MAESRPPARKGHDQPFWSRLRRVAMTSRPGFTWSTAYAVFALALTLWTAAEYFGSMKSQLFLANARAGQPNAALGWSGPLDDVFIHFDFARATARGFPFQWSEGNGYSSGGTSLLYPFVLAVGYRIGFDGQELMLWAGMIACVSVWLALLAARVLTANFRPAFALLLPISMLSVGALNWSLFSGMEVAFFMATWGGCLLAWKSLVDGGLSAGWLGRAAALGGANFVLVATRPEAAVVVACCCVSAVVLLANTATGPRREVWLRLVDILAVSAAPGALLLLGQAFANKLLTGDYSAAGALVKLELNHPYLGSEQVWEAWKGHVWYQFARITNYHFSEVFLPLNFKVFGSDVVLSTGWAVWILAAVGLGDVRSRRYSVLLWCTMLSFMAVVALNGQVRWQNERYTMPSVAWLLLAAGIGLASLTSRLGTALGEVSTTRARNLAWVSALGGLGLATLFAWGQKDRDSDQVWFFGRASRNIHDQHMRVGEGLRVGPPRPRLVLLGDAGAIPYVADIPALDIIGLGGFQGMPFARASGLGVGAIVELLERIPEARRPDVMALYPTWWKELPLWFGAPVWEAPVRGNVICGGSSKVVYRADWSALSRSGKPFTGLGHKKVVWELDVADLISERSGRAHVTNAKGFVAMKLLSNPVKPKTSLWDAGRILPEGSALHFTASGLLPQEAAQILLRVAPTNSSTISVDVPGSTLGTIHVKPGVEWQEHTIDAPAHVIDAELELSVRASSGETLLYHVWLVQ